MRTYLFLFAVTSFVFLGAKMSYAASSFSLEECTGFLKALGKVRGTTRSQNDSDVKSVHSILTNLEHYQAEELAAYLKSAFELEVPAEGVYEFVRALSNQNLRRILKVLPPVRDLALLQMAQKAIRAIQVRYPHNTAFPPSFEARHAWLSAAQLNSLGFESGNQSQEFNQGFLNTNNWVFFYANRVMGEDRYGENAIYMNGDYANKRALIFPYVMEKNDLLIYGATVDSAVLEKLERVAQISAPTLPLLTRSERVQMAVSGYLGKSKDKQSYNDLLKISRARLKDFLFVPEDFSELVSYATVLYSEGTRQQEDLIRVLNTSSNELFLNFLGRTAFSRLGLPAKYELRVPVAVPEKQIMMTPGALR